MRRQNSDDRALRQSRGTARSDWTIYFIATKVWMLSNLKASQVEWLDKWSAKMRAVTVPPEGVPDSSGPPWWPDSQLLRNPKYDRILAVVFLDLRKGLALSSG